ncbi:hypothetical protein MB27_08185 [Actinoplanes utahensis]|uniref:Uncharacterized protein n=2 Tax=Actinoplanes utahensis TaxID=1869 RepID=A0A0A6UNV2_ACTUT|nr:hypothetical protein MB27_08185 [Actinoplanes utahensis]
MLSVANLIGWQAVLAYALALALPGALPVFHFPAPTGHYGIGTVTYHWVDRSRPELFTADPDECSRRRSGRAGAARVTARSRHLFAMADGRMTRSSCGGSECILLGYAFWGMRSVEVKASGSMSRFASRLLFLPVSTMSGSARSNQSARADLPRDRSMETISDLLTCVAVMTVPLLVVGPERYVACRRLSWPGVRRGQ